MTEFELYLMPRQAILSAGFNAYRAGISRTANPYPAEGGAVLWQEGWDYAARNDTDRTPSNFWRMRTA